MDTSLANRSLSRLAAAIAAERARLASAVDGPARRRESEALAVEEIAASCALAGAPLGLDELRALLERGLAAGGRPLRTYLVAAGYADAAAWVAKARAPRRNEPFLRVEDVVEVHARALRLQPEAGPGAWRRTTLPPFRAGVVPPAFWLVSREIAHFVERLAVGPRDDGPPLWIARALEHFDRIRPFAAGNARAGRLVANLLLRRLGLPPFAVRRRDAPRYLAALANADSGDPSALALLVARSLLDGLQRLVGASAADANSELMPLASLVRGSERDALYKAAQRGRLRVVRRGRALLSTRAWLEEYRATTADPNRA